MQQALALHAHAARGRGMQSIAIRTIRSPRAVPVTGGARGRRRFYTWP
jgi:hypothetical protein